MKIINKYEEKLRDSISKKSNETINDLIRYFNNSDSTDINGEEEAFIEFTLNKREDLSLNSRDSTYFYDVTRKHFLEMRDKYKDLKHEFSSFNRMYSRVKLKRIDSMDLSFLSKWIDKKCIQ